MPDLAGGEVCRRIKAEPALDITKRKRAEEALRHERDKAQRYLDIAAVMFVALNTRGEVVLLNVGHGQRRSPVQAG